ncbi:MAG: hypothetical protein AB1782_13020, partial [Cyanobacteriota bacterium]
MEIQEVQNQKLEIKDEISLRKIRVKISLTLLFAGIFGIALSLFSIILDLLNVYFIINYSTGLLVLISSLILIAAGSGILSILDYKKFVFLKNEKKLVMTNQFLASAEIKEIDFNDINEVLVEAFPSYDLKSTYYSLTVKTKDSEYELPYDGTYCECYEIAGKISEFIEC